MRQFEITGMKQLPAWVGWPGTGPAPGHGWVPGPKLRSTILSLVYAFLVFALTINYVSSAAYFLVAIVGLYVGFRRGFVNGLTRAERFVMFAFAAYVGVAIASYLFGTRTNIGFRFLGRDLRLLLFIPVYLAVRWARPKREHAVWALSLGAIGAAFVAMIGALSGKTHLLEGVTGTHIVFGDLTMLMGAMALLVAFTCHRDQPGWRRLGLPILAVVAGIATLYLAHARGGMLTLVLVTIAASLVTPWAVRRRLILVLGVIALCAAVLFGLFWVRYQPLWQAYNHFRLVLQIDRPSVLDRSCLDSHKLLLEMAEHGRYVKPFGASLKIVSASTMEGGCSRYGYAMRFSNPLSKDKPYIATFRRSVINSFSDSATVLARGRGSFSLNGGLSEQVNLPGQRFEMITLHDYDASNHKQSLSITVPPKGRLYVIPIQKSRGEYMYPLLSNPTASRLQMWQIALSGFIAHPALGNGEGAFNSLIRKRVSDRLANSSLIGYQHPHNDLLNAMVDKGVLGLLAYLLVLAVPPLVMPAGGMKRTMYLQSVALGGFGLTESMMVHSFVIVCVVVMTSLLMTLGIADKRESIHA